MTPDQPYQITLDLEMPESPTNMELGMFLVKMSCYSLDGQTVGASMRTVGMHTYTHKQPIYSQLDLPIVCVTLPLQHCKQCSRISFTEAYLLS